jgi:hypothetical protein
VSPLSPFPDLTKIEEALSYGHGPEFDRAQDSLDKISRALDVLLEGARDLGVQLSHDPERLVALFVSHAENLQRQQSATAQTPHSC